MKKNVSLYKTPLATARIAGKIAVFSKIQDTAIKDKSVTLKNICALCYSENLRCPICYDAPKRCENCCPKYFK